MILNKIIRNSILNNKDSFVNVLHILIFMHNLIKCLSIIKSQLLTSTHTSLLVRSIIQVMQTSSIDPKAVGIQLQNQNQHIQQANFKRLDSQSQILLHGVKAKKKYFHRTEKDSITRSSSKKLSSLLAGKKARQRKKAYLSNLEQNVQDLQHELKKYDDQIKKAKQTLTQALNSQKNNENGYTFSELKFSVQSDDPNYDKINLLLDMIKFRIGASGKQRQAKIDYFFKQVINALFPSLHRYMMHTSEKQLDLFQEKDIFQSLKQTKQSQQVKQSILSWTKKFLGQLQLSQIQKNLIYQRRETFVSRKLQTGRIIQRLNIVKWRIKDEEVVIQDLIDDIRKCMTPVQAGTWAIFAQKYNLQSELALIGDYHPVKKMKLNQSQF